jgi:hypothetical protein
MILQERHGQTALSPASDKMAHAVAIVSPTKPQAPRSWSIRSPWPRVFLLLISLVSCAGSLFVGWHWSQDNRIAAALTDTLLSGTRDPSAFDSLEPLPSFSWWSSTTDHLYLRGVALAQRREDIASQDESEWLLDLAENAGPFHGGVRHARMEAARVEGDADRTATPPSEVATLVSAARKAAQEGHHETAAEHARSALAIVARSDPILAPAPRYDASSAVRRAHLPQEDQYLTILEGLPDMNAGGTQRLQEWLPRSPVAWLATIRLLRERSRDSAEGLAAQMPAMIEEGGDADRRALARAACAEAEALLGRWEHARQGYQDALGLTSLRRLRAIFWLNLADVSLRLDDIGAARSAREEARENALGDEKMSNVVSAAQADRFTQNEMASRPPASRRP